MYRDKRVGGGGGGGGSKAAAEMSHVTDRKKLNVALDKHLDRSSPSTSTTTTRGLAAKDPRLSMYKSKENHKASRSSAPDENKNSDVESETDSEESDISGSDGEDTSWISWYCNLRGNEFFCEVDDDYIQDDFNLCGLSSLVPYYDYALDLILDVESSHGDMFTEEQNEIVESAAEMLYGLIHVRYILTTKGLAAMLEKYKNAEFGRCPRVYCCGQPCLPVGQSDIPRQSTVKIYCPRCEELYTPRSRYQDSIDGAYFGTTFPHLFLLTYGHLKPQKSSQSYVPRVFGFKVHKP
ncbi:putative casein kinase II subunit beta-4 isoform X1 [Ipomoea triloba]|uniref:putative casein kinase II subunit beta-4 isoform X1 n=1 Tax=Ipomoea triloba TaxID=35885 RepID=UPI00125D412E|nr:putative casein kinase II subunit beta-4 isoform X1 [Ipomoea triloba]